jgi:hypothetical protein
LVVDRCENNRKEGGDGRGLARVDFGIEVEIPITHLWNDVDGRLALMHVEGRSVDRPKALGKRLELPGIREKRLHLVLA